MALLDSIQSLLGPSVASGQDRALDLSQSNFDASTGQPLSKALTGFEVDMQETSAFDPSRSNAADPFGFGIKNEAVSQHTDTGINRTQATQITPMQTLGLSVLSTGAQTFAALDNIKQSEKEAMSQIDQQFKNTEFAERLHISMAKVNEARQLLQSIDALNSQVKPQTADVQSQQFFRSPSTGMRLA